MKQLLVVGLIAVATAEAAPKGTERLPVGEFTATRFVTPPVIDGRVAPGEWDRAFTTSGLMTPFEHLLQESETTMSLGFDSERFYFLFQCRRGNAEWKLWKHARLNDDYSFGEPSVEIWVTPPTLVPETYQNILNTYPAVFDNKQVPSRGYTAQGWKGNWTVAVTESDTDYIIEASVPIRDFGFDTVRDGDVWRFLLARNCIGAKPRSQASWSVTQGFAEIPQHPPVRWREDELTTQLTGVSSILSGQYNFQLALVPPRRGAVEADVELRFHDAPSPGDDDRVEKKRVNVAGERQVLQFHGEVGVGQKGFFTVTVTKADGTLIYRQAFQYHATGWTPQPPTRPQNAKVPDELAVSAQYGPETATVLVKADILDLPGREHVASAEAKVVDAATGKTLASAPLRPFQQWYGGIELKLTGVDIPVADFTTWKDYWAEVHRLNESNSVIKAENEKIEARNKRLQPGQTPAPLLPRLPKPPPPPKIAGRPVDVIVTVKDKDGRPLRSSQTSVELIAYRAEWMNNHVGITDKVIPPWTPVQVQDGEVKVWNRTLALDGLGLARQVIHAGNVAHLAAPMRLVAVKDGQEIEIKAANPKLARRVDAEADLTGSVAAADLKITGRTRVEFDGFVNIIWDIAPAGHTAARVDKLYLEIALPAERATHFCVTAGGWAAIHDALPDHWTSQTTASGMLVGDFVPYIWLTDSDYAFLWFADHDRGWNHDPDKKLPTQEITRRNGKVFLRVNFFEIPTSVTGPRTITWGWQTFPSRPLPEGWRAIVCASSAPSPNTQNTYFWFDGDWAVLWPYYCSPFPRSMAKSKSLFDRFPTNTSHRPMVGSIAHSIGRYRDYEGNEFGDLAVDWGATPGQIGNADVTASKGPNDFRLWHYQRWVREAGFRGLYVDENYIALEDNFLTGNAYWRDDGLLQRAYNYVGLREYFKRMKVMFHQNNVPAPNLWQHITGGAGYHAWLGDIFFEGENVEPTDLNFDYIEILPAGRLRAIGSAKTSGGVMTMMCQSLRHKTQWWEKHTHQFLGWVMAHDVLPEQVPLYPALLEAGRLYAPDCEFHPYWKPGPFTTATQDCLVSAHTAQGRALLWVVNVGRQDAPVRVNLTGYDPARFQAVNAETGAPIALDAGGFTVPVMQRDFVPVLLAPKAAETFVATFEQGPRADFALGCDTLEAQGRDAVLQLMDDGRGGQALGTTGDALRLWTHLHLGDDAGKLTFRALLAEKAKGPILVLGPLSVQLKPVGKDRQLVFQLEPSAKDAGDGAVVTAAAPTVGWHEFAVAWANGRATLTLNGQMVGELPVRSLGIGAIQKGKSAGVVFGSKGNLRAVDDIRCYRH